MEQRISLITLGVTDLPRARQFYEQGLGLAPAAVLEETVFYQAGGMVVGLYSRNALAAEGHLSDTGATFSGLALGCNQRTREDVDAVLAQAAAAGGTLTKPAHETFWGGYSGYFTDPDGHPWEVAHNPFWRIDENGAIHMPPAI